MPDDRQVTCPSLRIRIGPGAAPDNADSVAHTIAVPAADNSFVLNYRNVMGKLQRVNLSHHQVSVIAASTSHSFHGGPDAVLISMMISADFLCTLAKQQKMEDLVLASHCATLDPFLLYFARALELQVQHHRLPDRTYLDAAAHVLGQHLLLAYCAKPDSQSGGLPRYKLRRALEFIDRHYQDDISFQDIAGHVGMSPFHFARMFKQATGEAPHQSIMRCRIDAAKRMLAESDKPIAEIAFEVGYKSQSYFTTRFARLAGMPPAAYRARC